MEGPILKDLGSYPDYPREVGEWYEAMAKEVMQAMKSAEVTMIPTILKKIGGAEAKNVLALVEALEDNEDVQNVYANFDISDEDMAALGG